MTDTEIITAIAEACGWTVEHSTKHSPFAPKKSELWHLLFNGQIKEVFHWGNPVVKLDNPTLKECTSSLPDYPNDLNAMHEAVTTLCQEDQGVFWNKLNEVVSRTTKEIKMSFGFHLVNATARQRAEAFLRTIGKWKEEVK